MMSVMVAIYKVQPWTCVIPLWHFFNGMEPLQLYHDGNLGQIVNLRTLRLPFAFSGKVFRGTSMLEYSMGKFRHYFIQFVFRTALLDMANFSFILVFQCRLYNKILRKAVAFQGISFARNVQVVHHSHLFITTRPMFFYVSLFSIFQCCIYIASISLC